MKYHFSPLCWTPLLLLACSTPLRAQQAPAAVEEATATTLPWSGWYWPAKTGLLVLGYRGAEPGTLVKHDRLSGKQAAIWEKQTYYHFAPDGANWWGHCHAWSAAALTEPEPLHDVLQGGVTFHVGDLKGLLTEAHYADHGPFYGVRFNNLPGDDFQDMAPSLVWSVLRKYLHDNQIGIIFDLDPGVAVDSHPAYRYRLTTQSVGGDVYQGQLSLWVAALVPPDFLGTATERKDYTFTFEARDGQIAAGSDHWTGASLMDHPDFAWYPAERGQANPELDYHLVSQLAAQAR
jgi:hypothetical protein